MTVLVMCVRVVRVSMLERGMVVRVAVRFFAIPHEIVLVLVVFIMRMACFYSCGNRDISVGKKDCASFVLT